MEFICCALCGEDDYIVLSEKGRFNEDVRNVVCKNCGLVYVNPRMTESENAIYYQEVFSGQYYGDDFDSPVFYLPSKKNAADRLRFLMKCMPVEDKHLLEVGCGAGHFLELCMENGIRISGIEPGKKASVYAKERLKLEVLTGRLEDISFEKKIDIVSMFHVLEHLRSPGDSMSLIHSGIGTAGHVYIEVPNMMTPFHIMGPDDFFRKNHLYSFTAETLTCCLQAAGFEVVAFDRECQPQWLRVLARKVDGERNLRGIALDKNLHLKIVEHVKKWRRYDRWYSHLRGMRKRTVNIFRNLLGQKVFLQLKARVKGWER